MSQGRDSALRNKLNYGFAEVVLYAEFAKIVSVKDPPKKSRKVSKDHLKRSLQMLRTRSSVLDHLY